MNPQVDLFLVDKESYPRWPFCLCLFSYLEPGSLFPPSLLLSSSHSFVCFLALFARAFALFIPCSTFNFWLGAGLVPPINDPSISLLLYLSLPIITRTFVASIQPHFLEGLRHDQTPHYCQHLYCSASPIRARAEAEGIRILKDSH